MSNGYEEVKDVGEVTCPKCKTLITIKRRVSYNQKDPRRKVDEELYAEKSIQTTLKGKEEEE